MRISVPIIAIVVAICCRLSPIEWHGEDRPMLQPPLPSQVLYDIYHAAAAGSPDDDDDDDAAPQC